MQPLFVPMRGATSYVSETGNGGRWQGQTRRKLPSSRTIFWTQGQISKSMLMLAPWVWRWWEKWQAPALSKFLSVYYTSADMSYLNSHQVFFLVTMTPILYFKDWKAPPFWWRKLEKKYPRLLNYIVMCFLASRYIFVPFGNKTWGLAHTGQYSV